MFAASLTNVAPPFTPCYVYERLHDIIRLLWLLLYLWDDKLSCVLFSEVDVLCTYNYLFTWVAAALCVELCKAMYITSSRTDTTLTTRSDAKTYALWRVLPTKLHNTYTSDIFNGWYAAKIQSLPLRDNTRRCIASFANRRTVVSDVIGTRKVPSDVSSDVTKVTMANSGNDILIIVCIWTLINFVVCCCYKIMNKQSRTIKKSE